MTIIFSNVEVPGDLEKSVFDEGREEPDWTGFKTSWEEENLNHQEQTTVFEECYSQEKERDSVSVEDLEIINIIIKGIMACLLADGNDLIKRREF